MSQENWERRKKSARVVHGKGKEEERGSHLFAPFPSSLARLFFKFFIYFARKDRFRSRGQLLCEFLGTKESYFTRKSSIPGLIFSVHQHGRRGFIVLYTDIAAVNTSCEMFFTGAFTFSIILLRLDEFITIFAIMI